nr:eukaryotic translation initiation factor 2 gamma subunit [Tanacetum cinerariifolium]
ESNKKKSRYELFYGSDVEDTDEEDTDEECWPGPMDDETRERMWLKRGPPAYNRKAVEEAMLQ